MSRTFSRRLCTLSTCEIAELRRASWNARKCRRSRGIADTELTSCEIDSENDYSSHCKTAERSRPRAHGAATAFAVALFVAALSWAYPLRAADRWSDELPAALAHQLLAVNATQPLYCGGCDHRDPAFGAEGLIGFVLFGSYHSALYMYEGAGDRYWLVNTLDTTAITWPYRYPGLRDGIDTAAALAQHFQRQPNQIADLTANAVPSATEYDTILGFRPRALLLFVTLFLGALGGLAGIGPAPQEDEDEGEPEWARHVQAVAAPVLQAVPISYASTAVAEVVAPVAVATPMPAPDPPKPLTAREELDLLKAEEIRRIRQELTAITLAARGARF